MEPVGIQLRQLPEMSGLAAVFAAHPRPPPGPIRDLQKTAGRSSWIRTNDLLLPKQALYQAELYSGGAGAIATFSVGRNHRRQGSFNALLAARVEGISRQRREGRRGFIKGPVSGAPGGHPSTPDRGGGAGCRLPTLWGYPVVP